MNYIKILFAVLLFSVSACSSPMKVKPMNVPLANTGAVNATVQDATDPDYTLGPGDAITINVWKHQELSATVPIRPDGRYSSPLIEDMQAAGKTPTQLGKDVSAKLAEYIEEPIVTVIVNSVGNIGDQNIRVLGQATQPRSLSYSQGMTLLDVMVAVGGLTEYADGNRAKLIRKENNQNASYKLRLKDLLNGKVQADRPVLPGDTIIIPESWF